MAQDGEPPKSVDKGKGKAVDADPTKADDGSKGKDGKPVVNGKKEEPAVGGMFLAQERNESQLLTIIS